MKRSPRYHVNFDIMNRYHDSKTSRIRNRPNAVRPVPITFEVLVCVHVYNVCTSPMEWDHIKAVGA